MSAYDQMIEGLKIFGQYPHNRDICFEHDQCFAGPDPEVVSAEDIVALEKLGWYPSEFSCFLTYS